MKNLLSSLSIAMIVFLLPIVFVFGCSKENEADCCSSGFKVLFQYEYVNYAWGFTHQGWFLDSEGNVKNYSLPENWKNGDDDGYISEDVLLWNYNQCDTVLLKVDLNVLAQKQSMIVETLEGALSEIDCMGADMGSYSYYAFYWDQHKDKYKRQLLSTSGDCSQSNISTAAKTLTTYLKSISEDLMNDK